MIVLQKSHDHAIIFACSVVSTAELLFMPRNTESIEKGPDQAGNFRHALCEQSLSLTACMDKLERRQLPETMFG